MTARVSIFAVTGLATAPVKSSANRYTDDGVSLVIWPYLGKEELSCDEVVVASSAAANAPSKTTLLWVEVQPGKRVAFEVTAGGQTLRVATSQSPRIEGQRLIQFGPGFRFSCIEVTATS